MCVGGGEGGRGVSEAGSLLRALQNWLLCDTIMEGVCYHVSPPVQILVSFTLFFLILTLVSKEEGHLCPGRVCNQSEGKAKASEV